MYGIIKLTTLVVALMLCTATNAQNLVWAEKSAPVLKETYAAAFSHDGKKVFSGSECGPTYLRVFDAYTGAMEWQSQIDTPLMCAQGVKFNSNGSKVATLEELGNLLIYDFTGASPQLINTIPMGTSYAFSVAFSTDGNKVALGASNKKLQVYDANTGQQLHNIDAHLNFVYGVDWSVKEQVATCGDDLAIKIWDTAGNILRTIANAHSKAIVSVKFTPDGNSLVSASKDNTIKVWDVTTGNLLKTLTGHTGELKQVDVSDDGSLLVSGSIDGNIKVWDMSTGTETHSFNKPNSGTVFSVDFAPHSNRFILAGTSNGDVQVWDILFPQSISDDKISREIRLAPNPSHDYVQISAFRKIQSLTVVDVVGKVMDVKYHIDGDDANINISNLIQGTYFVQVATGNNNSSLLRFVKQ